MARGIVRINQYDQRVQPQGPQTPYVRGVDQGPGLAGVLSEAAKAHEHLTGIADEANARELDNQLATDIRDIQWNPETGYLSTARGGDASARRAEVEERIRQRAAEVSATARSQAAQRMFERVAATRLAGELDSIAQHNAREAVTYANEQSNARVDNFVADAATAAISGDTNRAAASMAGIQGEVLSWAERNGVHDPAIIADRVRAAESTLHQRVAIELATSNPDRAESYFAEHAPSMDPDARAQTQASMRIAQAQAMRTVSGTVYRDFASGANYRATPQWREFTTNPLFGDAYMAFQEHVRTQALQSVTMSLAQQERISRHVGDELLSIAADERGGGPHALDLIVQAGQGRIGVVSGARGPGGRGQSRPLASVGATTVMSAQAFERETGMSYSDAQQYYRSLRGDALTEVLNRVNEASAPQALDASVARVLETAEAYAESAGVAVTGQSNAQNRARLRTYVYTRVRALAAQGGQIDELARDQIAREAVAGAGQNNRVFQRMMPYEQIPIREREAIERELGPGATPAEVESVYAEYLVNGQ